MELFAHFPKYPNKDYHITSGASFRANYDETLDSGTIRIDHLIEKLEIKPYDDVIIYSGEECPKKTTPRDVIQGDSFINSRDGESFYAHFLIGDISRQDITIPLSERRMNYTISLVSETKGLEKIILPNRAITQPRGANPITIREAINFILADSIPTEKVISHSSYDMDTATFFGGKKYQIDYSQKCWVDVKDKPCPEHIFNSTTLKDVLNFIVQSQDRIIVVHDWVIQCVNITEKKNDLGDFESKSSTGYATWMMSGSDYADRLRVEYSNALPQKTVTHYTEKLGFRNSDEPILTLQNMRLEFSHPIYDIKKIFLCYYKDISDSADLSKVVLAKYDITPLVILNAKRDLLSEDWPEFEAEFSDNNWPKKVEDIAKYKICTIGYDIGSKYINGWGTTYNYPNGIFKGERSYIENILRIINNFSFNDQFFSYKNEQDYYDGYFFRSAKSSAKSAEEIANRIVIGKANDGYSDGEKEFFDSLDNSYKAANNTSKSSLPTHFTQRLKSVYFECDYYGFVDGAVEITKDSHDGDVISIDSQSDSMAITESDGIAKKAKANRLGNATISVPQRITKMSEIHSLGDYDDFGDVIYQQSLSVFADYIAATYTLCKDYVLKNYYVGVISKKRPFPFADYNEATERRENKTVEVLLSKSESYPRLTDSDMPFSWSFGSHSPQTKQEDIDLGMAESLISFFKPTPFSKDTKTFIPSENQISVFDYSYRTGQYTRSKQILSDAQMFNVGSAMCATISMDYSIKTKAYISRFKPNYWKSLLEKFQALFDLRRTDDDLDLLTGSLQSYYPLYGNDVGSAENIRFSISSISKQNDGFKEDEAVDATDGSLDNAITSLYHMPIEPDWYSSQKDLSITSSVQKKDSREKISMTMEFDPVSQDDSVCFSEYMLLLSDLYGQRSKYEISESDDSKDEVELYYGSCYKYLTSGGFGCVNFPIFILRIKGDSNSFYYEFEGGEYPRISIDNPTMNPLTGNASTPRDGDGFIFDAYVVSIMISNGSATLKLLYRLNSEVNGKGVPYYIGYMNLLEKDGINPSDYGFSDDSNGEYDYFIGGGDEASERKRKTSAESAYGNSLYSDYSSFAIVSGDCKWEKLSDGESSGNKNVYHVDYAFQVIDSDTNVGSMEYLDVGTIKKTTKAFSILVPSKGSFRYTKNLFYVDSPKKLKPSDKYEAISYLPNDAIELDSDDVRIEISSDWHTKAPVMEIQESNLAYSESRKEGSFRVYYFDSQDKLYHFVFGVDRTLLRADVNSSIGYSSQSVYISFLDNRSKTVWDSTTGDRYGVMANLVDSSLLYGNRVAKKVK